jgi:hypothetical protein
MVSAKDRPYADAVAAEKERLFALSETELRALPDYSQVERSDGEHQFSVGLYHDRRAEGYDAFVAQAKRQVAFGFGYMFVQGFILRPDGSRDALPDDVFYEYA